MFDWLYGVNGTYWLLTISRAVFCSCGGTTKNLAVRTIGRFRSSTSKSNPLRIADWIEVGDSAVAPSVLLYEPPYLSGWAASNNSLPSPPVTPDVNPRFRMSQTLSSTVCRAA